MSAPGKPFNFQTDYFCMCGGGGDLEYADPYILQRFVLIPVRERRDSLPDLIPLDDKPPFVNENID